MTLDVLRLHKAIFGEYEDRYAQYDVPSQELAESIVASLPRASEREIIWVLYNTDPRPSLGEAGKMLHRRDGTVGVTRSRAGQLETVALRRLRHPSRSHRWKGIVAS